MSTYLIECCREDAGRAREIAEEMQKRGAETVLLSEMDETTRIEKIRACQMVLFLVSKKFFEADASGVYRDYQCCRDHATPFLCVALDNIDALSYRSMPETTYAFWSGIRTIQGINLDASADAGQKAQAILDAIEAPRRRPVRKSRVKPVLAAVAAAAVLLCGAVFLKFAADRITVRPLDDYTSAGQIRKGAHVTFGTYEQDGDLTNGAEPIEWIVLDRNGDKVLLLSQKLLAYAPYHKEDADVTWEDCSLRAWLNEDFRNAAFDEGEKAQLVLTRNRNSPNPQSGTDGGPDTSDRVFLLSESQAGRYFSVSSRMIAYTTPAARAGDSASADGAEYWWLRSPGKDARHAADVYDRGGIVSEGNSVWMESVAVRPAVWVGIHA